MAASQPGVPRHKQKVLGFYDISRAYFHSEVRRKIYIFTPAEDKAITTGLARLRRAMYGNGCRKALRSEGVEEHECHWLQTRRVQPVPVLRRADGVAGDPTWR